MAYAREVVSFGVATLFAGPVFVLAMAVTSGSRTPVTADSVVWLFGAMLISMPFGALVSFLPNWLGAWSMLTLGRTNVAMRLPIMWILAGSASGAAMGWVFDRDGTTGGSMLMAIVGLACAGNSRWFTRWDD